MSKLKVCVIFGGKSPEHNISLKSATSVITNLDREKYDLYMVGITKEGEWYYYTGDVSKLENDGWLEDDTKLTKAIISPDSSDKALIIFGDKTEFVKIDVVFPVLHGENGEDGTVQGLLELSGIKYVGMGVLSSAVSMDKAYTKIVFEYAGIPQADWITVLDRDMSDEEKVLDAIEKKLGYPCFVKPCNTGSSVGVGKAHNREELSGMLKNAFQFDRKVIVEEFIDGHEVECALLGNGEPDASCIGEIIPTVEFYDFDAKYSDSSTVLQIPAKLPEETVNEIKAYAKKAFVALDGRGLTRADFFVKYSDGGVVINEVNTLPGFTNISMYPKLWQAEGKTYSGLLDELINLGLNR
ncbi:MAG: D-alanine--D-alanine ligase family protein [Clostridia bacterium]|nr:D-alanine--D-alanine ligase family protein [Clostridia bacterium]